MELKIILYVKISQSLKQFSEHQFPSRRVGLWNRRWLSSEPEVEVDVALEFTEEASDDAIRAGCEEEVGLEAGGSRHDLGGGAGAGGHKPKPS